MATVLLVTADQDVTGEAVPALRTNGFSARASSDVVTGVMAARRERPDALVVDARLPGGGGPSLLQKLRGMVFTALTPAVGLADGEDAAAALRDAGAQEVATKPVEGSRVVRLVRTVLGLELEAETAPEELLGDEDRLRTLEATGLLDTDPEDVFDDVTALASSLLPVPVSLVTLVDQYRQFFKSRALDEGEDPEAWGRETSLPYSLCQWAVTAEEPLAVADAREHPVLKENRAVAEGEVVAYAGIPLLVDDQAVGTVCGLDRHPRDWDESDLVLLRDLASVARSEIQLRLLEDGAAGDGSASRRLAAICEAIDALVDVMDRDRPAMDPPDVRRCVNLLDHFSARLDGTLQEQRLH